jgi:hypothetical protein
MSALTALMIAAGCSHSHHPLATTPTLAPGSSEPVGTAGGPAGSGGAATPSAPPPGGLKPVLQGIIEINQLPEGPELPVAGGVAVSVSWSDLQPEPDGPIAANNPLDQAIASIRAINLANHLNLGIRARILAGVNAPDWVKTLGGPAVPVAGTQTTVQGTIGRFWTDPFGAAYDDLQRKLAAKYDDVPEVREVTASRCTTLFAEPLIRQTSDAATVSGLLGAGYDDSADDRCQHEMIDAHQVWIHTRTGVAFNPYQHPGGDPSDTAGTLRYMQYCRQVLGPRCVLENNSIRWPPIPTYDTMYQAMSRMGPPISFQTAGPARIGNLPMTLQWAVQQGADAVELSPGMLSGALGALAQVAGALRASPVGAS